MEDPSPPTSLVGLRPVSEIDLDLLQQWRNDPEHETEYGDFLTIHRRHDARRARWNQDGLLSEENGVLIVTFAGDPVGEVQWHTVSYGPNAGSKALNIGIALTPSARNRGIGTKAQSLLAQYLFDHTTTHRVEASTDVENLVEQRSLEKAGFVREGVLRGAQFRRGTWHDVVLYSVLRSDAVS